MEILEKVKSLLPDTISRVELEASEIVVYTKDKEFFQSYEPAVKAAVEQIKKRIEVRPESNLTLDQEYTKQKIKEIVPPEANIKKIYFEPERSLVIIAAEKPGLVIGKGGETFRQIRKETFWVPRIDRIPAIKSDVVEAIRKMMHEEVKFRKDFLNRVGENIFGERKASRDWVRAIGLGGWREVGRSCMLVETPKSKVLVDCGIKAGASNSDAFPIFNTKEFDYSELDAIVASHAHLDHVGAIPILYERGFDGPLYLTTPTLDLATLLWLDYIDVMQRNAVNPIFTARGVKEAVKHSIPLEYGEVSDIAPDVRLTFQNAGHVLGSALIHLHVGEGLHNIVYACDVKFGRTPLLDPAFTNFQRAETLVIESTYGGVDDVMPPRGEAEKQLMDIINRTMERNGVALIPSVDHSESIMIMNEGHIKIVKIGELCDRLFGRVKERWVENGCEIANTRNLNIKVPVFNPNTYKTEFKKLSKIIRHKINEPLYEITLETGRKCRVTASHSIFTLSNGKVVPKEVKKLNRGDFVVVPKKINSSTNITKVDLLNILKNSEFSKRLLIDKIEVYSIEDIRKFISSLPKDHLKANRILQVELTEDGKNFIRSLQSKLPRKIRNRTYEWLSGKRLPSLKFLNFVLEFCGKNPTAFLADKKYIKGLRRVPLCLLDDKDYKCENSFIIPMNSSKFKLPAVLKLNKELARLLGYFIADGCYGKDTNGIILTQNINERDKIDDIKKCMKLVFFAKSISSNPKIKENAIEIKGGGLLGYVLFSKIFQIKRKVDNKRIPQIVYNFPRELKKEFIKGWFFGDGSSSSDHIAVNTVNGKLASELMYLFLQLGYIASVSKVNRKSWSKRGYIFCVNISGSQLKKLAKEMNLKNEFRVKYSRILSIPTEESGILELTRHEISKKGRIEREKLRRILAKKPSKNIQKLVESDFCFLRVKEIKKVKPTSEFVYDLSVEGYENFIGGLGGVFLHNSFAVERAQDVMAILVENEFQYPVFIDGMIWDATGIYTAYPEYMSRQVQKKIFSGKDPFLSDIFKRVASPSDREKVLEQRPCVIISTSGMLVGGPALTYLQNLAEDPRNTLIFVGYQGEGTLGRRIQKGWREIPMKTENGKTFALNLQMEVQTVDGLSVSWDTPIMIKDNGIVKVLPIGSLVDRYLQSEGIIEVNNLEAPSFDKDGRISFSPIKYLIKHRSRGKMLEVITKSGRRVKVSKGHSLFVLKDGSIKTVPSNKINVGDYIIIPRKLPANPSIDQIDFVDVDKLNLNEYKVINEKIVRKKGNMKYGPLKVSCSDLGSLAKFIGYFLAEGDVDRTCNRISLSFGSHERALLQDAINVIRNSFGINPHFRCPSPSETQVCINSKLVANFLESFGCGEDAYNKRVPFFIFNLPKEAQLKCAEAYIAGDGYLDDSGNRKYLVGKSVNLNLLSDIAYLLLQNKITARIKGPHKERERVVNGKKLKETEVYKLLILGDKIQEFKKRRMSYPPFALPIREIKLHKIWHLIEDSKLRNLAQSYVLNLKKGRKHIGIDIVEKFVGSIDESKANVEEKEIIDFIKRFIKSDITADVVTQIKEVDGSEFEYDISVEGNENFVGGIGGIMLHNSGHSDRNQLLSFVNHLASKPSKVIVVHGENQKALELAKSIHKLFRIETVAPRNIESIILK